MAHISRVRYPLTYPSRKKWPVHSHGGANSPLTLARWAATRQRELQNRAADITAVNLRPQFVHAGRNRGGFSGGLRDLDARFLQASEQYPGPRTRWQ